MSHLHFLKSGSRVSLLLPASTVLLKDTYVLTLTLSWSERWRLCLYEDAARSPTPTAGFSFPSFYYQKDRKVFKSSMHRCLLNKVTLSLFNVLEYEICQMRTTVPQQSLVVFWMFLDTSAKGQSPLTRQDSCTQPSEWPTYCSTSTSWRHQTAMGSKRNMRWKLQYCIQFYF